mmetsp:Transcript_102832/g.290759  ORF Transcript_102832/g.290759 Transcript_102832/m.290759 type:complete len:976 (+) Transcript_102832:1169-4096(+)
MGKCRGAVGHHGVRRSVKLIVVGVQEDGMLPQVVPLAGVDELGNVELGSVQLDEIHQLLGLVLGIQDRQLSVHTDVRAVAAEAAVEQADELLEVAVVLVLGDQLLQVICVHNDVHARNLRATELLRLHASHVDLLPGLGVVGLPGGLHGRGVLAELHVAGGQPGIVRDRLVEDLGRLVRPLVVQAVTDALHIRGVRAADKLLHVAQALSLRVGVDKFGVDQLVLGRDPGHEQVAHELLVVLLALRRLDDLHVVGRVLGLEVRLDGLGHRAVLELGLAELVPNRALIATCGELLRPLNVVDVGEQRLHRLGVEVALLVDQERLLVQPVRIAKRDLGNLRPIVVVQAVDVVHDAGLVRLDCRQDQQVLQVPVLAEVGVVEDDLLQQFDELIGQVRTDESPDRGRDLVRVLGLWERSAHDLVDHVAPVLVLGLEHVGPELGALALHKVASLQTEEPVSVRHVDELLVAGTPCALVGSVGKVRVAVLAVLAHGRGVVEGVVLQEGLRLTVGVNVDLGDAVVQVGVLVTLCHPRLEPRQEHAQAVPLLHLSNEGLDRASRTDILQQGLDEVFGAIQVDQCPNDNGALGGVHLDDVDLDVLHEGVLVKVLRELRHVAVQVADVDQGPGVRQLGLLQEVLHDGCVVARALAADALDLLHVAAPARCLNVLEVHVGVGAGGEDGAQEVEHALVRAKTLEHLHNLLGTNLLVVLDRHLHRNVEVLAVVPQQVIEALKGRLWRHAGKVRGQELWGHLMRVQHDSLEVSGVLVVLQSPLHEARLLAELADVVAVVVREHVHLQDGLGDLGRLLQVHGQQLRLELGLVGPVLLQSLQQDRRGLLEPVLVHEDLDHLVDVDERRRAGLALQQALRKAGGALGVRHDHVLKQERVVGLVADLLDVGDNLVVLALLHEAGDHLLVRIGTEVNRQGELRLKRPDNVAQLLSALEPVLLEPLLDKLASLLLHHGPAELHRLKCVQLAVLEQG